MRSITKLDLQYAHRFYGFKGEAQYLHGHTGVLTIEVEDSVEPGVNMVFPCNEIQKTAWEVLKNFDHALILREDDPLLPAILQVYEAQGIKTVEDVKSDDSNMPSKGNSKQYKRHKPIKEPMPEWSRKPQEELYKKADPEAIRKLKGRIANRNKRRKEVSG